MTLDKQRLEEMVNRLELMIWLGVFSDVGFGKLLEILKQRLELTDKRRG